MILNIFTAFIKNVIVSIRESYLENDFVELWIEDGIIHEIFKPSLIILDIENAKKIVVDRLKVSNGIIRPILVDTRNAISIDKETRRYFASAESLQLLSAGALLIKNPIAKFMGNFFIAVDRPKMPVKIFTNKTQALKWLKQYLPQALN